MGQEQSGNLSPALTTSERVTIETWLNGAGEWLRSKMNGQVANNAFPTRPNYSTCTGTQCGSSVNGKLYDGGPSTTWLTETWSNRLTPAPVFVAAAAHMANPVITWGTNYDADVNMYVKEALMFSTWDTGTTHEIYRWSDARTTEQAIGSGWGHGALQWGGWLLAADHLARAGDPTLYNFSTTAGLDGKPGVNPAISGQSGTTKSLLTMARRYANIASGTSKVYISPTHTDTYWIRPTVEGGHGEDLISTMSNLYWNDATIKATI